MKPGLGLAAYQGLPPQTALRRGLEHIDEASLKNFVPADIGDTGHEAILRGLGFRASQD